MSWRTVVISNSAKLDYQMGYMCVRSSRDTTRIFLKEIYMVIIESTAVSITTALMSEFVHNKIKVVFCDEKRNPAAELLPFYGAHDCSGKLKTQIAWDDEIKELVWTEIVTEKIRKQAEHLEERSPGSGKMLYEYINQISVGDSGNREGHAAKVYFNMLFGMGFTRTEDCYENAALNYGYSILLSSFTREIVSNGYSTKLGLFHDNQDNPFNLASDLMEPFRPIVDRLVCEMDLRKFDHEEKMELVNIQNHRVRINGRDEYVSNAIQIYCRSVFESINNRDISEIIFYQNELPFYENTGHV